MQYEHYLNTTFMPTTPVLEAYKRYETASRALQQGSGPLGTVGAFDKALQALQEYEPVNQLDALNGLKLAYAILEYDATEINMAQLLLLRVQAWLTEQPVLSVKGPSNTDKLAAESVNEQQLDHVADMIVELLGNTHVQADDVPLVTKLLIDKFALISGKAA